jgi:hypothetical protein
MKNKAMQLTGIHHLTAISAKPRAGAAWNQQHFPHRLACHRREKPGMGCARFMDR